MIKVKLKTHSICTDSSKEILSWILTYPRMIHSEIMTHRVFSRNAASSRAIPVKKMLQTVMDEPAMFEFWGKNQSGMQSVEELTGEELSRVQRDWLLARDSAVSFAEKMSKDGAHKQIVNRIIEPWAHMTTMITMTEFANFISLRAHKDAQPEFQVLAFSMLKEYLKLRVNAHQVRYGDWHIPFGDKMPEDSSISLRLKIATARAARVSYLTFDGEENVEKDLEIFNKLSTSGHWSPFEHCAQAVEVGSCDCGNFVGWKPYRKFFPQENVTEVDYESVFSKMPSWVAQAIEHAAPSA